MSPLIVFIWIASIVAAVILGQRKGHPVAAFFCALVASWIGVVVVAFWRDDTSKAANSPR